jgi:hypothetical protein
MNESIYRLLRTSAAYFADILPWGNHSQKFTTFAGLVVNDPLLPSSPSVENITEEIQVFTDLELKDLRNVMVLRRSDYVKKSKVFYRRNRDHFPDKDIFTKLDGKLG